MNSSAQPPRCYVFDFPRLDTVVEVETSATGVVIHASRDTFSSARKTCFIRELAAEGFIADDFAFNWSGRTDALRWLVQPSEFMPNAAQRALTRRFMLRLFFSVAALWVLLMGGLFLFASR